jgi:hypothetical protein
LQHLGLWLTTILCAFISAQQNLFALEDSDMEEGCHC